MQRPKQEGLGAAFGGGMTDQMFGAQTTDVLQKGTVWLTVTFFVVSMLLAILIANRNEQSAGLTESLSEGAAPAPIEKKEEGLPSLPKPPEGLTPAVPVETPAKPEGTAAKTDAPKPPPPTVETPVPAPKGAAASKPTGGVVKGEAKAANAAKGKGKAKAEAPKPAETPAEKPAPKAAE